MSEIKVNSIKGVAASSAAITISNTDGTATANLSNRQGKNLVINGAMTVQQRMTNYTSGGQNLTGIKTVDRFRGDWSGTDNSPTQIPVDVAAGTTPYSLGFRRCFKIINGNQTSGAGAGDFVGIDTTLEAQDIANSGWNYTSSSSNITLSFWVKSSVAQNFYGYLFTSDGTSQIYPFETGSLSADTWTKVTKTISGNSNLTFNNDNGAGLQIQLWAYIGTTYTDSGVSLNQWSAYASGTRTPDNTSTWYTTDDATLELTGVQLEVGSHATTFDFRSYSDELMRCYRYYQVLARGQDGTAGVRSPLVSGGMYGTTSFYGVLPFKNKMRTLPSLDVVNGTDFWQVYNGATDTCDTLSFNNASPESITLHLSGNLSATNGIGGWSRTNHAQAYAAVNAEI